MDTVTIWVGVLGFVLSLVFCCVIVALRQLTVMRESVSVLKSQVTTLKEENWKSQKQGGLSSADTQQLLQQVEIQRDETEELSTRVNMVEKEVKVVTDQVGAVQMQAKRNSAKIDEGIFSSDTADSPHVSPSGPKPLGGGLLLGGSDGGGFKRDVSAIYEEILSNLKASQTSQGSAGTTSPSRGMVRQGSFRGSPRQTSVSGASFSLPTQAPPPFAGGGSGLSLELPQPLIVYQEISSGLYQGGQFRKFEHHIRIGDGSIGDLELVFIPVRGKRRIGGGGGGGSSGTATSGDASNDVLVFPLPDLREIKLDSEGTLPDGPSMKVLLTTRHPPTTQQLRMMGADLGGTSHSGRGTGGAGSTIGRRRRDAFATVEEVRELDEMTFVFQSSCSPLLDDWADFVTAHCGDCVVYPAL